MKKLLFGALGAVAAAASVPASAAVVLCTGNNCVSTDENVLVNSGTAATITGTTNNTGVGVTFSSTTDATLVGGANGQADVGSADQLLNSLTFQLQSGFGFSTALFNLFPLPGNAANEATSVFITYFTPGLGQQTQVINTNGQNFIGISGNAGEIFTGAGFIANPASTGIQDMRQLRLGGVARLTPAVPEPSTWAMMLLGMFGVGASMRARRGKDVKLTYA